MSKRMLLLGVFALFLNANLQAGPSDPCEVAIGAHKAVAPVSRGQGWWMPRHQAILERVAEGNVDLLMIGDSITHYWENTGKDLWEKYYAPRNAVNLGFAGDRTENLLWRLQNGEIENIHPKLAVLMIGTNNSGGNEYTAEQIADGIKASVCILRTKLPDTKVLILAIFPRGGDEAVRKTAVLATSNERWEKNDKAGRIVSELADGEMIFFLNINQSFLNEQGELTREVMPDLLHPGKKGYQIWAEAMEPTVARLMGETE